MSMPKCRRNARSIVYACAILGVSLVPAQGGRTLAAAEPESKTVRLVVDYGDGIELHFTSLEWRKGMTVLDALSAAKAHRRGVSFKQRGSGRSAMVTEIGGEKNEGGGATSKNWIFYVNDEQAEVGAGVQTLAPGDVALWRYQQYDYNP